MNVTSYELYFYTQVPLLAEAQNGLVYICLSGGIVTFSNLFLHSFVYKIYP